MRKLISVLVIGVMFTSCITREVQPIEKYRGKKIIVVDAPFPYNWGRDADIRVKTKDNVFIIYVPFTDTMGIKVGDTL